jgi:hypothetical protein
VSELLSKNENYSNFDYANCAVPFQDLSVNKELTVPIKMFFIGATVVVRPIKTGCGQLDSLTAVDLLGNFSQLVGHREWMTTLTNVPTSPFASVKIQLWNILIKTCRQ